MYEGNEVNIDRIQTQWFVIYNFRYFSALSIFCKENAFSLDLEAHTCNPSTQEAQSEPQSSRNQNGQRAF